MVDIALIKSRIDCVQYAQSQGLPITKSGQRCVSPIRPNAKNKSSFVVNSEFWYDFGDSTGGDVIDLCAFMEFNGNRGAAIQSLARLTGVEDDNSASEWVEFTQGLCNQIEAWHCNLTDADREYLYSRAITDDTISRLKIGRTEEGRLSIPYFKNGYVAYYCTRAMPGCVNEDKKYMKAYLDGLKEHVIWGLDSIGRSKDLLVIAEGAFDAMSFYQEGYSVISPITGHFNSDQTKQMLDIARQFDRVMLIFDNDTAGSKFTQAMSEILFENKISFIVSEVPRGQKDVSDYYSKGNSLDYFVESAEPGIQSICKHIDNVIEFEKFAKKCSRRLSKPDLALLFSQAERSLVCDKDWLKELRKICFASPAEDEISKQVIEKHFLKFNPKIGFYEYNGRFWELIEDEIVQGYIGDELGVYRTGSKLSSILKIVKADAVTSELFNVSQVINFCNGTLELAPTIRFREHSPDDNCTYCLSYPYDPEAKPDKLENFIEDVTNGDTKKASLLQEFAGYVLYPDNRLQKALCLIGDGANGKSVYLKVLSSVYGEGNVSSVEMSALAKDFNAIHLMNSLLNISAETRSDVSGCEEKFKKIVAGDSIQDSYKGKDLITFVPRAKMILACNEFSKSKDTTDGWVRRFCFCRFPNKYVENPTKPFERLINKNLEEELTTPEQLSAAFNWCLQGYEMLKNTGYFTLSDDTEEITEEFKQTIDPVFCFVQEFEMDREEINNNDLYKKYTQWCEDSGHKSCNRNSFLKRVRPHIERYRTDLKPYRTNNSRGYKKSHPEGDPFLDDINL